MYKANINSGKLKEYLCFLCKQGLIEERTIKHDRIVFAITQRGINILKYFRELTQALPIIEEIKSQTKPMLYLQKNQLSKLKHKL